MKRYKEGDKVRVIKKEHGHHFEIGDVVVIEDSYYGATDGTKSWSVTLDEIEPYEEESNMKYKVGDKVKVIKEGDHGYNIGDIITITEEFSDGSIYRGNLNESDSWYVLNSEIEPYEEGAKMKTRDKDYTGCHPQIAEALKQGKEVYCKVWDDECECHYYWVIDYKFNSDYPYITGGPNYEKAEPYTPKVKVRKASEIVKWLEDERYKPDYGDWVGESEVFVAQMFQYCGKEKPTKYNWLPEWLEEV